MDMIEALTIVRFDVTLAARPLTWRSDTTSVLKKGIFWNKTQKIWENLSNDYGWGSPSPAIMPTIEEIVVPWEVFKCCETDQTT